MKKQLKALATMGVMALALGAPTLSQAENFPNQFWHPGMMTVMDKNKDRMITRHERMESMGDQFDKMDAKKKGMLNKQEFTNMKMIQYAFPTEAIAGG